MVFAIQWHCQQGTRTADNRDRAGEFSFFEIVALADPFFRTEKHGRGTAHVADPLRQRFPAPAQEVGTIEVEVGDRQLGAAVLAEQGSVQRDIKSQGRFADLAGKIETRPLVEQQSRHRLGVAGRLNRRRARPVHREIGLVLRQAVFADREEIVPVEGKPQVAILVFRPFHGRRIGGRAEAVWPHPHAGLFAERAFTVGQHGHRVENIVFERVFPYWRYVGL